MGYRAYRALEAVEGAIGEVVNAFTSTINARIGDELVVFTVSRRRSPISINLDRSGLGGVSLDKVVGAGDPVVKLGNTARMGSLEVDIGEATLYFNTLKMALDSAPRFGVLFGPLRIFRRGLAVVIELLEDVIEEPVSSAAERSLHHAMDKLATGMSVACSPHAVRFSDMLGLGQGFTPSSDDFILGFAAAWNAFSEMTGRLQPITPGLLTYGRTNWVSYKLLESAARLDLLEPLDSLLYELLIKGSPGSALLHALDVAGVGHSSGIYILKGLLAGLETASACAQKYYA